MKEPIQILVKHLLENHTYYVKGSSVYENGTKVNIENIINDDELLIELNIFMDFRKKSVNVKDLQRDIKDQIIYTLNATEKEKANALLKTKLQSDISVEDIQVFVDMLAETNYRDIDKFMVDTRTGNVIQGLSVYAYKHIIGVKTFNEISPNFPLAYRRYEPYKILESIEDSKLWTEINPSLNCKVTVVNECVHPNWRYNRDLSQKLTKDEIYFIESSFVDKETLQYYIDAAYHTIVDKMWAYPMLFGIKGTGKTTLVEMLIPCVGKENYRKAPQNALQKEFNGFKKNKRLVLMDEMVANTDKAINILKSDANKEFNIEEKNKETEAVKNFVSMWIATNNISDWKFTHDERRFSVLELTSKTTQERGIDDSFFETLKDRLETDEFANAFFNYLEANKSKDFSTMQPFKSEAFYKVVYESLAQWQAAIVDTITMGEPMDEVPLADLFEQNDRFAPTTHKKVIDFLDNYRHEGLKLGEYVRGKSVRSSSIIPNDKWRAKPVSETSLEDIKK